MLAVGRALGIPSDVLSHAMPDALVIEQQREIQHARLAEKIRALRFHGPR